MTGKFSNLKDVMESDNADIYKEFDLRYVGFICLYQIANSLIDISKGQKAILEQMKKRKV